LFKFIFVFHLDAQWSLSLNQLRRLTLKF
jgi:hypothetical protein